MVPAVGHMLEAIFASAATARVRHASERLGMPRSSQDGDEQTCCSHKKLHMVSMRFGKQRFSFQHCRLGGNPRVGAIMSATCQYPVSWFTLLAASKKIEQCPSIHLECQSITPPLLCQWVYPGHSDQTVAQPQTKASLPFISGKLAIYQKASWPFIRF